MGAKTKKQQKKTILLYCEWDDEVECAKHIRSLWGRKRNKEITIKNGHGGSPSEIVRKAICESEWYDEVCVWIDADREELDFAIELARKHNITIVLNAPDFEMCVLNFHEIPIKQHLSSKKQYEKYFPGKQLNNTKTYRSLFSDIEKLKVCHPFISICELMF